MIPTRDHEQIRRWAERYDAVPAELQRLKFDGQPAMLTFVFGGANAQGPEIYLISWESFFAQFDVLELSMAFDEDSRQFDIVQVDGPGPEPRAMA